VNVLGVLIDAQFDAGRLEDAEESIDQLLTQRTFPQSGLPHLYMMLGLTRRNQGRSQEARSAFEQALHVTKSYAIESARRSFLIVICWQLAELSRDEGDFRTAISRYRQLLEFYNENDAHRPPVLNNLGTCYVSLGRAAEGAQCFAEVLNSPIAAEEDIDYAKTELSRLRS
jgi:tetratricopeptide (TPR) repeat protein